jgi:hypothetical protein
MNPRFIIIGGTLAKDAAQVRASPNMIMWSRHSHRIRRNAASCQPRFLPSDREPGIIVPPNTPVVRFVPGVPQCEFWRDLLA